MSNIITKEYLGNAIEFKMIDGHVYANANKMSEGFGGNKKLENWKASPNTKRYIEALANSLKSSELDLIESTEGKYGGTWIHEKLVLNFARYLNVEFELWCDEQIETLIREGEVVLEKKVKTEIPYNPVDVLKDSIEAFKEISDMLGLNTPKDILVSMGIQESKEITGHSYKGAMYLTNKVDKEDYHTGSYIMKQLGIKVNRTNDTFKILGLQIDGDSSMQKYKLTDLGKEYGVSRSFTNKSYQGYEIKWKETVIDYIKDNLSKIPNDWFVK